MKKRHIFQSILGTLAGTALLFSCSSEEMDDMSKEGDAPSKVIIPEANEQKVKLNINYDVVDGYKVVFDVYAENPYVVTSDGLSRKEGVRPIVSAMTDEKGRYEISRVLPGGVKEVYVTSDCAGVPALLHGTVASGQVTPVEINLAALQNQVEDKQSRSVHFPVSYLGDWNYWGRPDYVDKNKTCKISNHELRAITSALPEWLDVNPEFCTAKGIRVEKEAEVWVSLLSEKSLFNNALGYYCYKDGMGKDEIAEVIALPRTNICSLFDTGLRYGEYVKLKYYDAERGTWSDKFPAGTNIGWVLHRSGYNTLTSQVSKGTYQFYSNSDWNPENSKKGHTAIFKTHEGNLIIGFEDTCNDGMLGGDNDCNDIVCHVAVEPEDALAPTVEIPLDKEDEVEEVVDVVQPLPLIIDVPASLYWHSLYVASKSTLVIGKEGKVTGVKDVLYIADFPTMNDMVSRTYTYDEVSRKVVVRTSVKLTRNDADTDTDAKKKKGRILVRTTVKDTSWDVEAKSRTITHATYANVEEVILNAVYSHMDDLKAGKYVQVEIAMEFEEGVPYEQFVNSIDVPPYSPFIENVD